MSLIVIHKTLRLFVDSLKADEKHYLLTRDNLTQPIQIALSQKQKTFFEFFFDLLTSILNFKHLPKRMTLIADAFPQILAPKHIVR